MLGVGRAMTRTVVDMFDGESRCAGVQFTFSLFHTAALIQSARVRVVSNANARQIKLPFAAFEADG